ncbi:hypothetical protein [Microbacterium hibisci]|uniref:hypothetical protein n=1 Tax=Microbacterium hibisci TaxID=2036000 RepID=UPI0019415273|nr:hypothetical protein [Microbacterium hibisci]
MTSRAGDPLAGPPDARRRPGVGLGLLAGAGLLVFDLVVLFVLLTLASGITVGSGGVLVLMLPFLVVLAGSVLLMLSWYWRWFALGLAIVTAASAIAIGPFLGLLLRG